MNQDFAIITTCMDRGKSLEEVLPSWIATNPEKIVIVDWSSTEDIQSIINQYPNENIFRILISGKSHYHRTKPVNVGMRFIDNKYILKTDCDVVLDKDISDFMIGDRLVRIEERLDVKGLHGTYIITKKIFEVINGLNEHIERWGYEEMDFMNRIELQYPVIQIDPKNVGNHIAHNDSVRIQRQQGHYTMMQGHFINERISSRNPWGKDDVMEKFDCVVYHSSEKGFFAKTI